MARVLVGSVIGGGAATVALRPDLVTEWAKDKALQGLLTPRAYPSTAGNSREIQELYKLVSGRGRGRPCKKLGCLAGVLHCRVRRGAAGGGRAAAWWAAPNAALPPPRPHRWSSWPGMWRAPSRAA